MVARARVVGCIHIHMFHTRSVDGPTGKLETDY